MTKTVDITSIRCREDRSAIVANYQYILTDELGRKSEGSGSIGIGRSTPDKEQQDGINREQVQRDIIRKLGYSGVRFTDPNPSTPEKRGPGRPPLSVRPA